MHAGQVIGGAFLCLLCVAPMVTSVSMRHDCDREVWKFRLLTWSILFPMLLVGVVRTAQGLNLSWATDELASKSVLWLAPFSVIVIGLSLGSVPFSLRLMFLIFGIESGLSGLADFASNWGVAWALGISKIITTMFIAWTTFPAIVFFLCDHYLRERRGGVRARSGQTA